MKRSTAAYVVAFLSVLAGADAFAQKRGIDVQLYKPAPLPEDLFTLETARVPRVGWNDFTMGLHLNFGRDPLIVIENGKVIESAVSHLLTANFTYAVAPFRFLLLAIDTPIHLFMDGSGGASFGTGDSMLDRSAAGDLRFNVKWKILGDGRRGFGLAFATPFTAPTGSGDRFRGEPGWTTSPRLIMDYLWDRVGLAWQLGYFIRERVKFGSLKVDDEIFLGLGTRIALSRRENRAGKAEDAVTGIAELLTRTSAVTPFDKENQNPLELLVGARFHLPNTGWDLTGGVGIGLQSGYGIPAFRLLAAAQWTPQPPPLPAPCPACREAPPPPACPKCLDPEPPPPCPLAPKCAECPACPECPKAAPPPIVKKREPIKIRLKAVYFATGKWIPLTQSNPELDRLVRMLKAVPTVVIRIEGHTDAMPTVGGNPALSQKRVNQVRAYLIKNGITGDRVTSVGFGEKRPVADNKTEAGRQQNRRVEVHIVSGVPDDVSDEMRKKIENLDF